MNSKNVLDDKIEMTLFSAAGLTKKYMQIRSTKLLCIKYLR